MAVHDGTSVHTQTWMTAVAANQRGTPDVAADILGVKKTFAIFHL